MCTRMTTQPVHVCKSCPQTSHKQLWTPFGVKVHIPRAPLRLPQEDWPAWKEPTSPGCARNPERSVEAGPQALCPFLLTPYPLGRQINSAPNLWGPGARGIRVVVPLLFSLNSHNELENRLLDWSSLKFAKDVG